MSSLIEAMSAPDGTTVTNLGPVYVTDAGQLKTGVKGGKPWSMQTTKIHSSDGYSADIAIFTKMPTMQPGNWYILTSAKKGSYSGSPQFNCSYEDVKVQGVPAQQGFAAPAAVPTASLPPSPLPPVASAPPMPPGTRPMPFPEVSGNRQSYGSKGVTESELIFMSTYFRDLAQGLLPKATHEQELGGENFGRRVQAFATMFNSLMIAYFQGKFDVQSFMTPAIEETTSTMNPPWADPSNFEDPADNFMKS